MIDPIQHIEPDPGPDFFARVDRAMHEDKQRDGYGERKTLQAIELERRRRDVLDVIGRRNG